MNQQDEDKIISGLYQQANQEQPPKALDDLILKHAEQSNQPNNGKTIIVENKSWRPWLMAASVVLALPMVWLLTQNQELRPETSADFAVETQQAPAAILMEPEQDAFNDETEVEADSSQSPKDDKQEIGEVTLTSSRMRNEAGIEPVIVTPMLDLQQQIEQQGQQSITGKPIDYESLEANKALLMNELKAKKRTIKPSTMDPLMALEYEQFGRYLDEGNIDAADDLLTDMQENWPDFDFEDMILRLALAETGSQ